MQKNTFEDILLNQINIPINLIKNYKHIGLNEEELAVVLQVYRFIYEGNTFPTPNEIADHLTIGVEKCIDILKNLMQKNFLTIEESNKDYNKLSESYSLNPLWEKLFSDNNKVENLEENDTSIFILFEQEFGRPLSPFEIETITVWLDEDLIKPSLIKAGLRESVLMGKLNFRYIDRILREWQRKGIKSVEEAREASKPFHKNQPQKTYTKEKRDTSIYYNWLEGE